MDQFEEDLSPQERKAFASLHREEQVPPFLEDQTVEALKRQRLIRPNKRRSPFSFRQLAYAVAVALVFFGAGLWLGGRWRTQPANGTPPTHDAKMSEFMLVLLDSPELPSDESKEEEQRVAEYRNWALKLQQRGLLIAGEKLTTELKTLNNAGGGLVISGTQVDRRVKPMAGYFLIEARDYQQAIEIASDCPHLKYGGTIELRRIDHTAS
jgi:hypothetical protein